MAYEELNSQSVKESGLEKALDALRLFACSPALDEMSILFGRQIENFSATGRLAELQTTAAQYWDFRKGAERQQTNWDDSVLGDEKSAQWTKIFAAATKLGMVESTSPTNKTPDYLVILGGANRAPLDRLRYGLEQVDNFGHLVYMGSDRLVTDIEKEKAKDYAPEAQTEFDLGCGVFATLLSARLVESAKAWREGEEWGVRVYEFINWRGEVKRAFALNSPQMIGTRRATTYDNYRFFAETVGLAHHAESSVVSVTTGFYVPGQHAPAMQEITLPYGIDVETIGHSAEYSGVRRLPTQLLQETRAAVDAYKRLSDYIIELHLGEIATEGQ